MTKNFILILVILLSNCTNTNNQSNGDKGNSKASIGDINQPATSDNSEFIEFVNEFYYDLGKSESIYTTLRDIKNNPNLSKGIIDSDDDLVVELVDHPYLNLENANAELLGFAKHRSPKRKGYSGFSITLYNQRNLNNFKIFEEIMDSMPVEKGFDYGQQSKSIFYRCKLECENNFPPQIISEVNIYSNKNSNLIDKDVDGQVFKIVFNFDFDHDGLYN